MYNRYIGNTGKVHRVHDNVIEHHPVVPEIPIVPIEAKKKKSLLGGLGIPQLSNIFQKGTLDLSLPFGLSSGDLVMLALLLFLYIESGDEEFLIILGFLVYSIYKDN